MGIAKYEIPADELRWQCDPALFDFECTKDLAPLREFIGQERAIRAIEFGLSMNHDGYNMYVAGLTGTGKTSIVRAYIDRLVKEKRTGEQAFRPEDWCYVHNFSDPDRPQIMNLPQGRGKVFRDRVSRLLQRLKEELAKAFSSDDYQARRKATIEESQAQQKKLFESVSEEAQRQGFVLQMTSMGPIAVPLVNGKPLSQEEYLSLDESARKELETRQAEVMRRLQSAIQEIRVLARQGEEKLTASDRAVADHTVAQLFSEVMQEYQELEKVHQYLDNLKSYTLDNLDLFKDKEKEEETPPPLDIASSYATRGRDPYLPFAVNVFVDNSDTKGPPVVDEPNPSYGNLFGKAERRFLLGGYLTDHTMLKAGSLQLANGGYLLLGARDVLMYPGVWQSLKQAIKSKEARIEDPFEAFGLIAAQGMRPQPMPISVKVVLVGDVTLYHMLSMYDEEFWETFRVKADFDFEVDRNNDNIRAFAAFICGCCEDCELHHFDRTGVAKVLEYASRIVSDQHKLSSRFAQIRELVQEAEYWSRKNGNALVTGQDVEKAIEQRIFRHNLPDERIKEMIGQGIIMIDTEGDVVGQVNGLSVYILGDAIFGKPSRITCKTFLGRGGVINIEREAQLSGSIHDKGVLILGGYLGWKYAQDKPLSLSATLCFEQSYEGVEGDSASSAELYALISSLAEVPIKQGIAVTGSVNQQGEIQAIGGVNEKIEGFFQVCKAKGLNGQQGVLIPNQNIRHLMLREEVVNAVQQGKFHIYAVSTIDEGLEVLTGRKAGQRKADGTYPKGTINHRVDERLREMARTLRQYDGTSVRARKRARA